MKTKGNRPSPALTAASLAYLLEFVFTVKGRRGNALLTLLGRKETTPREVSEQLATSYCNAFTILKRLTEQGFTKKTYEGRLTFYVFIPERVALLVRLCDTLIEMTEGETKHSNHSSVSVPMVQASRKAAQQ